nr:hypothetical protein [Tanacetum cinerariifolium]
KYEHNTDFYQIVDFVEASHLSMQQQLNELTDLCTRLQRQQTKMASKIATQDLEISQLKDGVKLSKDRDGGGTPTEPHHTPSPEAQQTSLTATSSPSLPPVTTVTIPIVIPIDTPQLRQYTRRARIAQSSALPPVADEHASLIGDDSQGEACPTDYGLEAEHDRENITKTSTLPSDSTPRVTSLAADEGSMQQKLNELMDLYTMLQRQQDEMASKITAQDLEISQLKARVKLLQDIDGGCITQSEEDAPIKGRSLDEGEEAASTGFNEFSSNIATALVRARIAQSSALPPVADEPASPIGDDSQGEACPTISGLEAEQDRTNITKTSTLPSYSTPKVTSFAADEGTQDLEISQLKARVKLLEDRDGGGIAQSGEDAPIKGRSSDEGEEATVEISTKRGSDDTEEMVTILTSLDAASILTSRVFVSISPVTEVSVPEVPTGSGSIPTASAPGTGVPTGGVPTGSSVVPTASTIFTTATVATPYSRRKEEGETFKRKGLKLEQGSAKKVKTSEEVSEEDLKNMMQLVPVEELWALVKETLNIRQATSDKEKELWVELKRLYEPDVEDQLWTYTQTLIHDPVEWRLYDSCGVHHVLSKDQEIFMLVEKDYPLRKGLAIVMISNKLHVENYS